MIREQQFAADFYEQMFGEPPPVHPLAASLTAYSRHTYRQYKHAAHLAAIDEKLEGVTRYVESGGKEGIGRLIIAMPPRHGKTLKVSRIYPTWHLGRNPLHRMMLISYGQSLANKNSRIARNWLKSDAFKDVFPGVNLAQDSANVMEWDIAGTDGEGGASAQGASAAVTGKGAHVMIIDDPVKNREQAESKVYREKIYQAYTDDLYTRLEPGGAVIVMATRWHEDDLTGRLLKHEPEKWDVLSLPAIALENDPLGREEGAALWPERYPVPALVDIKTTLGPYSWSALYQQNPQPAEGGIIKAAWFTPAVRIVPDGIIKRVRYWDLAMSSKTSADYTVGVRVDEAKDGTRYIVDVARAQVELADLAAYIKDVIKSDGPDVYQGFEQKGYMTRAIDELRKDKSLGSHVLKGYDVDKDKLTRLLPAAARAAAGIYRIKLADWNNDFLRELKSFPVGSNDDQVDAFSGADEMINDEYLGRRVSLTPVGKVTNNA